VRRLVLALLLPAVAILGGRAALEAGALPDQGRVTRVVDGDTLEVSAGAREETVRLLGVDTPELHRPGTPVECGARAAAQALEELSAGREVELVTDPTQDARDRYGRLLAYVDTDAGTDLGEAMVRRGWAEVYVFERPFRRVGRYRAAARGAGSRGVGEACGGDFHSAS